MLATSQHMFSRWTALSMLTFVVLACNRFSGESVIPTAPSPIQTVSSPTLDYSTPAPPSSTWTSFASSASDLSFDYPSNWYAELDEENNRVRVSNASPDSVISIKGGNDDFMRVDISLHPTSIGSYGSIEVYVDATVKKALPVEDFISAELLPPLPQGYSVMRVTTRGLGETVTLYVTNRSNFVTLQKSYVPGKQGEQKYLAVMEQIANTITFP